MGAARFYRLPSAVVIRVLRAPAGMPQGHLAARDDVLAALTAREAHELDFADALHITRSARCTAFVSFDQALLKRAAQASLAVPMQRAWAARLQLDLRPRWQHALGPAKPCRWRRSFKLGI